MAEAKTPRKKERLGQIGEYWLVRAPRSPYWHRIRYDKEKQAYEKVSLGEADFSVAQLKLAKFVSKDLKQERKSPDEVRLFSVLDWYYDNHGSKVVQWKMQKYSIERWKEFFTAKTVISDLTPFKIVEFTENLTKKRKLSLGTISRVLGVGRAALNAAADNLIISAVPKIKDCQTQDDRDDVDPMGRPLEVKELAKLFANCTERHIEIFMLISMYCLCRPEAAIGLTKPQVDFDKKLINLNPKGRRQNKKFRPVVKMPSALEAVLKQVEKDAVAAAAKAGVENFAFQNYVTFRGKPVKSIQKAFQSLVTAAGIDGTNVTLYSIRHTMGRELRKERIPTEEIGLYLGHKPRGKTTVIYAPFEPDYLKEAVDVVVTYAKKMQAELKKLLAESTKSLPKKAGK